MEKAYGLDCGTIHNRLVSLEKGQVEHLDPIGALDNCLEGCEVWVSSDWSALAELIANEIVERNLFTIGIDCALTRARTGDNRPWEKISKGFNTPASFDPWPVGGSVQQQNWWKMSRLWTEVTWCLVMNHRYTLFQGESLETERLIVEVYPRLSWLCYAASRRIACAISFDLMQARDDIVRGVGINVPPRWNRHDRDATICAMTAICARAGRTGFLGEGALQDAGSKSFRGGGIAVPLRT
jgi:hypothetical protein